MKLKLLFGGSILMVSLLTSMAYGNKADFRKENNPIYKGEVTTMNFKGKDYRIGKVFGRPQTTRAGEMPDIIWEAEGQEKNYTKESAGTFVLGGNLMQYWDSFPASMVWGEDNSVYIQDIISIFDCGSYVKGTFANNVVTVPTNQILDYSEEEGYGVQIVVMESKVEYDPKLQEEVINFYYDPSITEFSYTVGDNGSLSLVLPGEPFDKEEGDDADVPQYVLGTLYTDEDMFVGFCDYFQDYTQVDYQITTMPKDAEIQQYVMIDEFNYAFLVDVAFDKGKIYIKGLSNQLPTGVIIGDIEGDKAYIAQDEYLGVYMNMSRVFTKVLYDNPDYNEDDETISPFIHAPSDVKFELNVDSETGIISATTPGVYLAIEPDIVNPIFQYVEIFGQFVMKPQSSAAGTPANPINLEYETKWAPMQGWNDFFFTLSNFSTEGTLLNTETLYYRVWVDGEPVIFGEEMGINLIGEEAVMYPNVPGQQYFLPYDFNNNEDIFKYADNIFDIGIYVEGVSTVSVQSMYRYDGEVTYSDVITLDVETGESSIDTGVEQITMAPVVAQEFYTLSGVKIQNPDKGIYIVKEIHADGKVTARKVALKK